MTKKMSGRLVIAIVSTIMEEATLAAAVFWGLPWLGVELYLWGSIVLTIVLMAAWGTYTVLTYRMGSRALRRKPVHSLMPMIGSEGKVVSPLAPEGMVRIKGELWKAKSVSGRIDTGEKVIVVGQNRLELVVRRRDPSDLKGA